MVDALVLSKFEQHVKFLAQKSDDFAKSAKEDKGPTKERARFNELHSKKYLRRQNLFG